MLSVIVEFIFLFLYFYIIMKFFRLKLLNLRKQDITENKDE